MTIKNLKTTEFLSISAKNRFEELLNALQEKNLSLPENKSYAMNQIPHLMQELEMVLVFSEFVASTLTRNPGLLVDLVKSGDLERSYPDGQYKLIIEDQTNSYKFSKSNRIDNIALKEVLCRTREREMVRIAWQDIVGKVTLEQTLKDLSDLADACVDKAITFIYDELCSIYGTPLDSHGDVQRLVVFGMGKLGAGELNFSSDIDLIFAYPEDIPFVSDLKLKDISDHSNGIVERTILKETSSQKSVNLNTTGEFFTKMCKNFLKIFDSSTCSSTMGGLNSFSTPVCSSMLFRVDTRLRPFGANGPIAMSFYTMEEYYQTQGRDWERYALIKARPIAGDIAAGYNLLKILNPFVYRRYFDYGSFDALREMKKKISLQVRDKRFKNNIKLGAGGIREIEFFGQVFQLIRGGVEPEFQELKILKVLDLLVQRNCIDAGAGDELAAAYCFLRKVEHRLQEYNDRQTHDLPEREDEKLRLALSMGFDNNPESAINVTTFYEVLNGHMARVHSHFLHLFASDSDGKQEDDVDDIKYIWQNINDPQFDSSGYRVAGFENSVNFSNILKGLAEHPNTKKLTTNGRKRLDRLMPLLIHRVGAEIIVGYEIELSAKSADGESISSNYGNLLATNIEIVLKRLIDLIIAIERRTCYLSLLIEKPQALDNLVTLAARSPWIISFLSLHPALLDELLAPSTLYTPPDRAEMEKEIIRRMAHIPVENFEFQLEELCIFKQVMTLRVAAADLSGHYPLMKVSDRLTEIAETVMNKVIEISWHHTVTKYGMPSGLSMDLPASFSTSFPVNGLSVSLPLSQIAPGLASTYSAESSFRFFSPGFAAIAYGKLGGIELGYKSDLDMVFIYSGIDGYTEGGSRSIENIRFYTFLGQRIINALTLNTQAGKLYDADMRLRPSGQSGMIVSHIDAFHDYINNEAWTWEHQAIIRARPIGGDPTLQQQFNTIREKILCIRRERDLLQKEVREMRERMRKEHLKSGKESLQSGKEAVKSESPMFDLKQGSGGIIDIEFLVQYLVLQHAESHPALTQWTDNVRLLETLANENILTSKEASQLKQGYLKLRQMVHHLNLQEREKIIPVELFQYEAETIMEIFKKFLYL